MPEVWKHWQRIIKNATGSSRPLPVIPLESRHKKQPTQIRKHTRRLGIKRYFTKKDLHTGDIIENRAGERGVVILETDCIVYQAGGLDIFGEVFTDDLFVDGTDRSGDIIKVYHDTDGRLGFNKLFGQEPVFVRKSDLRTRERTAGLSEKHDPNKGKVTAIVLELCYREYQEIPVDPSVRKAIGDIDMTMSEAPSMTAAGQIKIDRTFVPVPAAQNLFLLYNKYQESGIYRLLKSTGIQDIPEMKALCLQSLKRISQSTAAVWSSVKTIPGGSSIWKKMTSKKRKNTWWEWKRDEKNKKGVLAWQTYYCPGWMTGSLETMGAFPLFTPTDQVPENNLVHGDSWRAFRICWQPDFLSSVSLRQSSICF